LAQDILRRKLLYADLGVPELDSAGFYCGVHHEGHPVCYTVPGKLVNHDLYHQLSGDDLGQVSFIKWRVMLLERGVRDLLNFSTDGASTMLQVLDMKNLPMFGKHLSITR
jgi:hypothetical protein